MRLMPQLLQLRASVAPIVGQMLRLVPTIPLLAAQLIEHILLPHLKEPIAPESFVVHSL
jgi:hypothetical protein